jgi:hypothetical protein
MRRVRRVRWVAGIVVALVAAGLLSACSNGSAASGAAVSTPGSATLSELTQAFLSYAQCARTHGLPDLPDPVVDVQGNDSYPGYPARSNRWPASVLNGCASVWAHVHAVRAAYDSSHSRAEQGGGAMTPAQALAFSRCIRQHGFPTFPDPGPDGTVVNVPPGFDKRALSEAAKAAIQACQGAASHG